MYSIFGLVRSFHLNSRQSIQAGDNFNERLCRFLIKRGGYTEDRQIFIRRQKVILRRRAVVWMTPR